MLLVPQVWLRLGASNAAANQRKRLSLQTPFHRRRRRRRLRPPPLRAGLRGRPRAAGPPTLGLASRGPTTATTAVIPSPLPRPTSTSPASPSTSSSIGATRTPTPPSSGMDDRPRSQKTNSAVTFKGAGNYSPVNWLKLGENVSSFHR